MQTRLDRITDRARKSSEQKYNNLFHHLDVELMTEAFSELKEDRAPGVDGVTKEELAKVLQEHLQDLEGRLHRRAYRPSPARRRMIPVPVHGVDLLTDRQRRHEVICQPCGRH